MDRFWAKVDKSGECWLWIGHASRDGYGRFWMGGKVCKAHRVAFNLELGPIPEGMHVLHRCDCRSCVRPGHLFIGTNADNVADCVSKGRNTKMRGEANGGNKLIEADILKIRADGRTLRKIAADYGVSNVLIYKIKAMEKWVHIHKVGYENKPSGPSG